MTETPYDPDVFLNKAKQLVADNYKPVSTKEVQDPEDITLDEIYIVWFAKVLGNWKALVSTSRNDGLYFEVTYNGAKNESYVDTYIKIENVAVSDATYLS